MPINLPSIACFATAATALSLAPSAHADAPREARLSVTGSASEDQGPSAGSSEAFSVSASVLRGRFSIGASVGFDARDSQQREGLERLDRSSSSYALFGDVDVAGWIWGADVFYAPETFDAVVLFTPERPRLPGVSATASAEVETWGASVSLSRTIRRGDLAFTPSARVGWSQSETTADAELEGRPLTLATFASDSDGANASLALSTGWQVSETIDLGIRVSGNTASAGSAARFGFGGSGRNLRPLPDASDESQTWVDGEVSVSLALSDRVSLELGVGASEGRETDDTLAFVALSYAFGER
ncbi:hypothetical protein GC169_13745 [bacterium]|nr:hypothetical protein [bacterium]